MSLATRCTACGTVFRVVQDQLRVSSGWVRCGRCGEVFNAIESLVDLDVERQDSVPASVHGTRVMEELARVSGAQELESEAHPVDRRTQTDGNLSAPPTAQAEVASGAAAVGLDKAASTDQVGATATTGLPASANVDETMALPAEPDWRPAHSASVSDSVPAASFLRQAERAQRWRHPAVRAVLGLLLAAMLGTWVWQINRAHHDWLAARWPELKPLVQRVCEWSGCVVGPPRALEGLLVESSGLIRPPGAGAYRLSLVLRNRAAMPVRLPALDISLSDAGGRLVARRVLLPADLQADEGDGIGAGEEIVLAAQLRIDGPSVVGYTIEIFYP